MDAPTIARIAAGGRTAIGIALIAAPAQAANGWLGDVSKRPGAQVAISGVGARDLVLGLGLWWAAGGRKRGTRAWLIGGAAADVVDIVSTVRAREALSTASLAATLALAGGSAVLNAWLQSELD